MFPEYKKYQAELSMKDAPINVWRDKIKNCKFDCWECNYCEAVIDSHMKKSDLQVHPHVEASMRLKTLANTCQIIHLHLFLD